jgi:hypothetical protein
MSGYRRTVSEHETESPGAIVNRCISLVSEARKAFDTDAAEADNLLLAATLQLAALDLMLKGASLQLRR